MNERVSRATIRPPDEDEYPDNPANSVKAFASVAAASEIKGPDPASGVRPDSVGSGGCVVLRNSATLRSAATACSIWPTGLYELCHAGWDRRRRKGRHPNHVRRTGNRDAAGNRDGEDAD